MSLSTVTIASVPRSAEMAQINQHEINKASISQANVQNAVEKKIDENNQNVISKDNPQMHPENFDAKEKGNNEYENQYGKVKKKEKKEDGSVIVKGHSSFDVKI